MPFQGRKYLGVPDPGLAPWAVTFDPFGVAGQQLTCPLVVSVDFDECPPDSLPRPPFFVFSAICG